MLNPTQMMIEGHVKRLVEEHGYTRVYIDPILNSPDSLRSGTLWLSCSPPIMSEMDGVEDDTYELWNLPDGWWQEGEMSTDTGV